MDITDSCLDAETLAAWVDGGLSASELERAETHVADCARCQALVGTLARINSAPDALAHTPSLRSRWLTWLVPLTAAAAAVAIWVLVPRNALEDRVAVSPPAVSQSADADAKLKESGQPGQVAERAAPGSAVLDRPAPGTAQQRAVQESSSRQNEQASAAPQPAAQAPARAAELRRDAAPPAEVDSLKKAEAPSSPMTADAAISPQAAPAPAPATPLGQLQGGVAGSANRLEAGRFREKIAPAEIVSPDPNIRWRITGTLVQRSTNGGAAWEPAASSGLTAGAVGGNVSTPELVAGHAPSTTVCWVVGRAGVVLLSTDGRTWRRLPFPEMTNLSAVRARDARAASVTTADGRTFSTTDAGSTWAPGPLQGF